MDPAPIWTDLKTFPWEEFRDKVDVLSGGYPCQPFSAAGKRLGTDDPRHLWPYIASGIRLLRPKLCFFENVEGHISLGLREVVRELEELGYETTWGIFSAAEVGAPHQRKRVFIMAVAGGIGGETRFSGPLTGNEGKSGVTDNRGSQVLADSRHQQPQGRDNAQEGQQFGAGGISWSEPASCYEQVWPSRPGQPQHAWEPPRVVANPRCGERGGREIEQGPECSRKSKLREAGEGMGNAESGDGQRSAQGQAGHAAQSNEGVGNTSNERCGGLDDEPSQTSGREARGHADRTSIEQRQDQRQTESTLGGDSHGTPGGLDYAELCVTCDNRADELRLLGNGVVPATAALAFRTLLDDVQPSVHH
jgi:DNA (cytosine-5)-methyltransferase 1